MKTAKEFWREKFDEEPQTDSDKLAVAMMAEYGQDVAKNLQKATATAMGSCSLCQKELHYPAIAGYCSKRCAEIAIINDLIIN